MVVMNLRADQSVHRVSLFVSTLQDLLIVSLLLLTELWELKDLLQEADEKKFPASDLKASLSAAISEAEKCAHVANQLVSKKARNSR